MSLTFTPHRRAVPASGAPFTSGSAINGTSINAAGKVVLGNDINDLAAPAEFVSNREIRTQGFGLFLKDIFAVLERYCELHSGGVFVADDFQNFTSILTAGAAELNQFNAGVGTGPSLKFESGGGLIFRMQLDGGGNMQFLNAASVPVQQIDVTSGNSLFPAVVSVDTIVTGDISTVADQWKLGNVRAAAVVLDATRYVEISIGGVTHRLGIVL
jgi:hypothetical protein